MKYLIPIFIVFLAACSKDPDTVENNYHEIEDYTPYIGEWKVIHTVVIDTSYLSVSNDKMIDVFVSSSTVALLLDYTENIMIFDNDTAIVGNDTLPFFLQNDTLHASLIRGYPTMDMKFIRQ